MKNIIESLYDGKLYPAEQITPTHEDFAERNKAAVIRYDTFKDKLDPSLHQEFDEMLDAQMKASSIELKQSFVSGFQLGANLMIEII